jgi:hypothetical protein
LKLFSQSKKKKAMSSIALGVWVAFLKQPALPGEAPQTKQVCSLKRPAAIFFYFFDVLYSAFYLFCLLYCIFNAHFQIWKNSPNATLRSAFS